MQPIEINLLQVKMREAAPSRLIFFLLLLIIVAAAGWLAWQYQDVRADLQMARQELEMSDELIISLRTKVQELQKQLPTQLLAELPELIRTSYMQPTEVLAALTPLLPDGANLSSLIYSSGELVKVTGHFASNEDVITFMQEIKQSDVFTYIRNSGIDKVSHMRGEEYVPLLRVTFDLGIQRE